MEGRERSAVTSLRLATARSPEWHADLSVQERADTDAFIAIMRGKLKWEWPDYRARLRDYKGLGELRWDSCKKQHRLIGFFMGGIWYAVMGCTHKQQIYNPADALNTADKRKKDIENRRVNTVPYDF